MVIPAGAARPAWAIALDAQIRAACDAEARTGRSAKPAQE